MRRSCRARSRAAASSRTSCSTPGKVDGKVADVFPFPVTQAVLERGHDRFNIYCSPCHDRTGNGNGMIVQRGMKRPATPAHPAPCASRRRATSST
jgi:hypothetical protein